MSRRSDKVAYRENVKVTARRFRADVLRWSSRTWLAGLAVLLLAATGARAQAVFGPEAVNATSAAQSVTVTATTAGTVSSVEVLTQGQAGLDFAGVTSGSTCTSAVLAVNGTCTESVTFTPSAPGIRQGAIVLIGTVGGVQTVLGTTYVYGTGTGSLGVFMPGNVLPVAGQNGLYLGSVQDGSIATKAILYLPTSEAVDGAGNLYIADSAHNRIRMVCGSATTAVIQGTSCTAAGIISTIAGNGDPGNAGNNGPASSSTLSNPSGVAVDGAGNLYIADSSNNEVREIVAATGQIVAIAGGGTGCGGQSDSVGDGCPALQAILNAPGGVTLDRNGNLYIADTSNERIREVTLSTGIITTVAGNGFTNPDGTGGYNGDSIKAVTAELNSPYAVAFDAAGNMYIPDSANNRIRLVTAISGAITPNSIITTYAGNGTQGYTGDGHAATSAEFWSPSGVAVDAAGNVYIADTQNGAIRKVNAASGNIATLVKTTSGKYYFNSGFANNTLYGPVGITLDGNSDLYIADTLDMVVREIQSNFVALDYTTAVRQNSLSTPMPVTIENDGNFDLDLTAINPQNNAQVDAGTTTCDTSAPLAMSTSCVVGAVFAPTTAANPLTTDIDVTSVTPNSPLDIKLVGDALAVNSTTTVITSTPNPSGFGQIVTFTVTVTTGAGTGNLTGTVSIADTFGGTTTPLASGLALNSSGVTTFQISTLGVGQHTIVASYSNTGDPAHFSSTSIDNGVPPLIQQVEEGTATTVTSSLNPSMFGQNVTFTATVAISGGGGVTPDGTVTFMDGALALGTSPLTAGVATYSTSALAIGMHSITAVYNGDTTNDIVGSTSDVLNQDVQSITTIGLISSPNPSTYGTSVTFNATVSSGSSIPASGTINFYDGATLIGHGTLGGNPGVATFATAALAVGTHTITASYAGDTNNSAGTSGPVMQVVNQTQSTTTLAAVPNPGIANEPVAIAATVKPASGTSTPTGTVTFTAGTTSLGSAALNGSGVATINPVLAAGTYQIVATYAGDTDDVGSTSATFSLNVVLATSTTALTVTPNPAVVDGTITFTASVTGNGVAPTGTVTFLSGTATLGTGTLNAGKATFTTSKLAAGNYSITASYGGDANNSPSTSGVVSLTVGLIPTTTGLVESSTTGTDPQAVLIAVVQGSSGPMPTGTVTFLNGTTTIGAAALDSSGVATLIPNLATGNYSIVASYSGDSAHSPSQSAAVSVTGAPAAFNLTVTPATVSLKTSENISVTVNLTSIDGFTDTIGLGCASLPAGVTCNFSNPAVKLAANGTGSAQLTIDTNSPLGGGASAMNRRTTGPGSMEMAGLFLPLSALFGLIFWRFRKRGTAFLTMVLVMALSSAALLATGCSGYSSNTAKPGTYVFQVTGTGTNSDVIHYANVSLTITNN